MTASLLRPLLAAAGAVVLTVAVGWAADRVLRLLAGRHSHSPLWHLLSRCRLPLQLTVGTSSLLAAGPMTELVPRHQGTVQHALLLTAIGSSAWLASRVLAAVIEPSVTRYAAVSRDVARVRRVRTQVTLIRRVLTATFTVIALAVMLMTFPQARAAGTSVLASAGVLGIVVGIAAQSTLGNLFAGLQIAFGDMVRIGDVVVFNGEWGTVEEITLTYVVLLTWDERRIVMPVSHFAGEPFENWSRRDTRMTGTVLFHLDHATPVDALRAELGRVVERSPDWDGRAWNLVVTDTTPSTIQVRALATAKDPDSLWRLRCEIREKLIAFVRERHPYALPRIATSPVAPQPGGDAQALSARTRSSAVAKSSG
jgi:small-conductance mechanosensitive channel